MKMQKLFSYLLSACLLLFLISCAPKKNEKDPELVDPGIVKIVLPMEIECGTEISHTYTGVCDTTEAAAKKKISNLFSQYFKCKANCNSVLTVIASKTGTCIFNIPTLTYGTEYDITVTLRCL